LLRANFTSFLQKCFITLNPGVEFIDNWHLHAIAYYLDQVRQGKIKRLIINMPPRSLKSISTSVAFPAFLHGLDPSKHIISVSYGNELSVKLHNDYREIINSDWYRTVFPNTRISSNKNSEAEVVLTGKGTKLATSIGGTLTGRGADIIIIDDPLKPMDAHSEPMRTKVNDWASSTLMSRLNNKNEGAIVLVSQRLHSDDLAGHFLEQSPDGWTVLNLPAIAEENLIIPLSSERVYKMKKGELLQPIRETEPTLNGLRQDLGSDAFEAQYQQNPAPPGGLMFKREWVNRYTTRPIYDAKENIIQSWDTASKTGPANDWSVCTTWLIQNNHYYLLNVFREKVDYPTLKSKALELAQNYLPSIVIIEETGVGVSLATELRNEGINVKGVTPENSKEARASVQAAKFEGGRIHLPAKANWLKTFEHELFAFPSAKHDDQVDSLSQALSYEAPAEAAVQIISVFGPRKNKRSTSPFYPLN